MALTSKLINMFRTNDVEGVRKILEKNINLNVVIKNGWTPLQLAVCKPECYEIVKLLIEAGADVNFRMPIASAAGYSGNNALIIKLLYKAGADISVVSNGNSGLIAAARVNSFDNVMYLINLGADVNAKDETGLTVLMLLALLDRVEIAKVLIQQGADVNMQNNDGATALMMAAYFNKVNYARLLIQNGADVNVKDVYGDTALNYAKKNGKQEIIDLMLEYTKGQ